jgi:hypothetical protein
MKSSGNDLTPIQKLGYLEADNLRLMQENTRLRKALSANHRHRRRIERAYEDALLLASWRAAGIIPSRRYANRFGVTQFRYENAFGLLKLARIIQGNRRWVTDDLETISKKLEIARNRALEDPDVFFLRLNKHSQPCSAD